MLNKKELEKRGFTFIKVDKVDYLDMSQPKEEKVAHEVCPMLEIERHMRNEFLKTSQERGKALSILLPLFDQEKMTDLLSELYDSRAEIKIREAKDNLAKEEFNSVLGRVGELLNHPEIIKKLNSNQGSKCRPKKKTQKISQKKAKK